jgi:hypothetical protein
MRSIHSDEDEQKRKKKTSLMSEVTSSLLSRDVFNFQIDNDEIMGAQLEREKKACKGRRVPHDDLHRGEERWMHRAGAF